MQRANSIRAPYKTLPNSPARVRTGECRLEPRETDPLLLEPDPGSVRSREQLPVQRPLGRLQAPELFGVLVALLDPQPPMGEQRFPIHEE